MMTAIIKHFCNACWIISSVMNWAMNVNTSLSDGYQFEMFSFTVTAVATSQCQQFTHQWSGLLLTLLQQKCSTEPTQTSLSIKRSRWKQRTFTLCKDTPSAALKIRARGLGHRQETTCVGLRHSLPESNSHFLCWLWKSSLWKKFTWLQDNFPRQIKSQSTPCCLFYFYKLLRDSHPRSFADPQIDFLCSVSFDRVEIYKRGPSCCPQA